MLDHVDSCDYLYKAFIVCNHAIVFVFGHFFLRKMSILVRHIQCNNNKIQVFIRPTILISNFVKFFLILLLVF